MEIAAIGRFLPQPPVRLAEWRGAARPEAGSRSSVHRSVAVAVPLGCRARRKQQPRGLRVQLAAQSQEGKEEEKSIEEKFNDFTTVLPWFGFAADIQQLHAERRAAAKASAPELPQRLKAADQHELCEALRRAYEKNPEEIPEVVEAVLQYAEAKKTKTEPTKVIDDLCGRWEAVWSGAFTPLNRLGLPRQSLWVEVTPGKDGEPPVATAHSGLPLVLFGAYLWTSCAGELLDVETEGSQVLIKFTRYWIDIGREPRSDIGRVDGGFINSRLSAFGAALVTPVLLEFGALKWLLERFGFERVFEVEVPNPESPEKKVKLQASLELYLTLLARVAFPDSLSTCPVPFLDVKEGLCVYEIPMLGPLGDLPLHPGGNSATLVARKLSDDEPVLLMR